MKFSHVAGILTKTDRTAKVSHCIISAGINKRDQKIPKTGVKELRSARAQARETFPAASIYIPLVNYSEDLPPNQKASLQALNEEIEKGHHITKLDQGDFKLDPKDSHKIHWTPETANAMLQHWLHSLN